MGYNPCNHAQYALNTSGATILDPGIGVQELARFAIGRCQHSNDIRIHFKAVCVCITMITSAIKFQQLEGTKLL